METSKILLYSSFLIVFIPVLFQFFMGKLAIQKSDSKMFNSVFVISIVAQVIFTIFSVILQFYSFEFIGLENKKEYMNTPPPIGGVPISIFLGIVVFIISYFQHRKLKTEKFYKNRKQ